MKDRGSISWLKCGVLSLGMAGLYSIILVILRTPGIDTLIAQPGLFKSALVVHVNLSVLVWLVSFSASIWSIGIDSFVFRACSGVGMLGSLLIAISPFVGGAEAITNNYVPMLDSIVFIVGLSLFGASTLVVALRRVLYYLFSGNYFDLVNIASFSSCLIFILSWICFSASYIELQKITETVPLELDYFYELLFWSGGHLLQFVYTGVLMISWVMLSEHMTGREVENKSAYVALFILNLGLAIIGLYGHLRYDIIDGEFIEYFTSHMKYAGGIAPALCLLLLFYSWLRDRATLASRVARAGIICSVFLFGCGGIIGALISEINVTVPAHYHGSVVGISVAFISLAYLFASKELASNSSAVRQIFILSSGQTLHILGLAIAGGYGVMRKAPGVEMALQAKIGMFLMGTGGLIAIIGGLMFVVICGKRLFSTPILDPLC